MAEALKNSIAFVGIDIGKNSFHVVGLDERGAIVLRQKWSRGQVEARFSNMPPCLIGMEACVGAHHLSRGLQKLGHDARLMPARRSSLLEGTEERLPRRRGDCRSGATPDDEVRRDQGRRSAGPSGDAPRARASGSQRTGIINQIRAFLLERNGRRGATLLARLAYSSIRPSASATALPG